MSTIVCRIKTSANYFSRQGALPEPSWRQRKGRPASTRIRSKTIDIGFLAQVVGTKRFIKYADPVKTVIRLSRGRRSSLTRGAYCECASVLSTRPRRFFGNSEAG